MVLHRAGETAPATIGRTGGRLRVEHPPRRKNGAGRPLGTGTLSDPEASSAAGSRARTRTKSPALSASVGRSERQGQFQAQQGLSPEERQKANAERMTKENGLVAAILDADQMKRYNQLVLQQQGATALAQKPVADKLNLTADQQDKIQGFMR